MVRGISLLWVNFREYRVTNSLHVFRIDMEQSRDIEGVSRKWGYRRRIGKRMNESLSLIVGRTTISRRGGRLKRRGRQTGVRRLCDL